MKSIRQVLDGSPVSKAYQEALTTKEWHSYAKEMRDAKGNVCEICRGASGSRVLQIHHTFYDPARKPWEYFIHEVQLLCDICHKRSHDSLREFRKYVFGKISPAHFKVLNGSLAVGLREYDPLKLVYAIASLICSPRSVELFYQDWIRDNKFKDRPENWKQDFIKDMSGSQVSAATSPKDFQGAHP